MRALTNIRDHTPQNEDFGYPAEIASAFATKLWYVVYTIVRHEKSVNSILSNKNIETFLPLRKFLKQWRDRKKQVYVPLFPGYIFVRIFESDTRSILNILNTKGVVRILSSNGSYETVPAEQIDSIRRLVDTNIEYDPYEYLVEGKEVMVVDGPLQGVHGKILERRGQDRLIVSIDIIKRAVSVKVSPADIELA